MKSRASWRGRRYILQIKHWTHCWIFLFPPVVLLKTSREGMKLLQASCIWMDRCVFLLLEHINLHNEYFDSTTTYRPKNLGVAYFTALGGICDVIRVSNTRSCSLCFLRASRGTPFVRIRASAKSLASEYKLPPHLISRGSTWDLR